MSRVLPQVENQLVITKAELDQLDSILGQQPAANVIGIIDFIRLINYKRNVEAKQQQQKEIAKISTPTTDPGGEETKTKVEEKTNPE